MDGLIKETGFTPNFIKLCADGFELSILEGAEQTIDLYKPVLFFQWQPENISRLGGNPMRIFRILQRYDCYADVYFYDNFGNYLMKLKNDDEEIMVDLMNYSRLSKNINYYYVVMGINIL